MSAVYVVKAGTWYVAWGFQGWTWSQSQRQAAAFDASLSARAITEVFGKSARVVRLVPRKEKP